MSKLKLLLHSCCAPCSTSVIEKLKNNYDLTIYFYNPNIYPMQEFEKRYFEEERFLKESNQNINLVKENFEPNVFESEIKGFENEKEGGARCEKCIALRLKKTAQYAKLNGFDIFASTLSVSPHKNAKFINEEGNHLAKLFGIKFLEADFKKEDGFLISINLSKKYNLYRQKYCGCKYSIKQEQEE